MLQLFSQPPLDLHSVSLNIHPTGVRHENFHEVGNGPGENPDLEGKTDNTWHRKKCTRVRVLEKRGGTQPHSRPRCRHTQSDLEAKPRVKCGLPLQRPAVGGTANGHRMERSPTPAKWKR